MPVASLGMQCMHAACICRCSQESSVVEYSAWFQLSFQPLILSIYLMAGRNQLAKGPTNQPTSRCAAQIHSNHPLYTILMLQQKKKKIRQNLLF